MMNLLMLEALYSNKIKKSVRTHLDALLDLVSALLMTREGADCRL